MSEDIEKQIRAVTRASAMLAGAIPLLGVVLWLMFLSAPAETRWRVWELAPFVVLATIEVVALPLVSRWMVRRATASYRDGKPLVAPEAAPRLVNAPREVQLASNYSSAVFVSLAAGSSCALLGFVGSFQTYSMIPYLVGAGVAVVVYAAAWPRRSWWARQLAAAGVPLDGVVAVPAVPATTGAATPDPEGPREPYAPPPL